MINSCNLFLAFFIFTTSCQTPKPKEKKSTFEIHQSSMRQEVLKNDIKDSLFIFGKWDKSEGTETQQKNLGEIKSKKEVFKIMTSIYFWGLSRRATNRILVFSQKNQYLGNYHLTMISDLPEKVEKNELVFLHFDDEDCNPQIASKLSFENRIPNEFFIEYKNGLGDLIKFESDN